MFASIEQELFSRRVIPLQENADNKKPVYVMSIAQVIAKAREWRNQLVANSEWNNSGGAANIIALEDKIEKAKINSSQMFGNFKLAKPNSNSNPPEST